MQKEFEKQERMKTLPDDERKKYEEDLKLQQQKHNKHEPLHHPGNKAQLEEVWEKQDHMDAADFDPKTFFMMHGNLIYQSNWEMNPKHQLILKFMNM